jgi:hypothetical protein
MNDLLLVESLTALVEHIDGRWEIVTYTKGVTSNAFTTLNSSAFDES